MEYGLKSTIPLLFLVTVGFFKCTNGTNQCPDLVPGFNMLLTETVGWIGDQPVTVSCSIGYVLDSMVLQKNISCISGGSVAEWSESVGSCQEKQCHSISTILGANMTAVNVSAVPYHCGENVTIQCDEGYAFDIDLTAHINRVTSKQIVLCEDNSTSPHGAWSSIGSCQLIVCDGPPDVSNSISVHNLTEYNSTAAYQCVAGYGFNTNQFLLMARCNQSAIWEATTGSSRELGKKRCSQQRKYMGCVENGTLVPEIQTESLDNGMRYCIDYCKNQNKRYAAVHNTTCSCGNEIAENFTILNNSRCNMKCPSFDGIDLNQEIFCGGQMGETELYVTLDGCYSSVNPSGHQTEVVTEHVEITCQERCRGRDFSLAVISDGNVCFCLNSTAIIADERSVSLCSNTSFYNTAHIFDLARLSERKATCSELFDNGVRMNGDYYLAGSDNNKTTCHFKDGTVCEDGWVGYNGYCYYFNNVTTLYFSDARDYCTSLEADLVSINSLEEKTFLQELRELYTDLWGDINEPRWWLGLVDTRNTSLYTWLDGSLLTYSNFHTAPSEITKYLAIDNADYNYIWAEIEDHVPLNMICKKPKDGLSCVSVSTLVPEYSFIHDSMVPTYCIQLCKGQQIEFALIQDQSCHCVSNISSYTWLSKSECSSICPGDGLQNCGGNNTQVYSAFQVSEKFAAKSCEELKLVGIDNSTFLIQTNETATDLVECGISKCPFSWVFLNGRCYKYILYRKRLRNAVAVCAAEDGYMVTFETESELQVVIMAAANITLYSGLEWWRVGLLGLSLNGGLYKWSNGRQTELSRWNNSATEQNGVTVLMSTLNNTWHSVKSNDVSTFICERGPDFKGCYSNASMLWDISIDAYDAMTIQQCVEFCRVNYRNYSYINSTFCSCEASLTIKEPGQCTDICSGQDNQVCGGPNVMSVYDVAEYPSFASNCTDLFLAGIFLSGTYLISGVETVCNFTDGTGCSETGWISIEGHCYKHFPKDAQGHYTTCQNQGAVQTSLTTFSEYSSLVQYVRRINFHGNAFRVFTGISHGGYDLDVFISQEGFLTDYNLLTNGHLVYLDLYDTIGFISFRIDTRHKHADGGVVCKKDKYTIGCFELPSTLAPILENFGSIELAQCRQLCIARGENVTLIGNDFCACTTEVTLSTFTPTSGASCDHQCNIHVNQLCGNGSVVWAYQTGIGEVPYAESCFHLYKSGILYNTTYRLKSDDPNIPDNLTQCGFADDTPCPAAWLGKDGECYRFVQNALTFTGALQHCANIDSYLFNPVDTSVINFVTNFINKSGLLSDTIWWTGLTPVFFNTSYMSSNGVIVTVDHSNDSNKPICNTVFHSDSLIWTAPATEAAKHTFICQKDKDFLGCFQMTGVPDAQYGDYAGNSITQCSLWCNGQGFNFAAMFAKDCACFLQYPPLVSGYGKCNIVCDGSKSQICGGVDYDNNVYHSVFNITSLEGTDGSCQDLFKHGVFKPGEYNLRRNATESYVKTSCFMNPAPLDYLHADVKSLTVTSNKSGHPGEASKLLFPYTSAWKPSTDGAGDHIRIILVNEYLITGIIIAGLHTHAEQSFVKSFSFQYRDLLLGTVESYWRNGSDEIQSGCQDTNVLCFHFLSNPVITNEIQLYPITWYNSVSLQLALVGQLFTSFDHSKHYIGCVADPMQVSASFGAVNNITECIDLCRDNFSPFASLDNSSICSCWGGDIDYGFVDNSNCPVNVHGTARTSNGLYRALYRTFYDCLMSSRESLDAISTEEGEDMARAIGARKYVETSAIEQSGFTSVFHTAILADKHCEIPDPNLVARGNISTIEPELADHGLYVYNTTVTYKCELGYELPDGTTEVESYCLQSNQWSLSNKTCTIISCPSFTVTNGNATIDSLVYGSTATITCHRGYWAVNNQENITVYCNHEKQWSPAPTCTVDNLRQKQRTFSISVDTVRDSATMVKEERVRSKLDCAATCAKDYYCMGANFKSDDINDRKAGGMCRLFLESSEQSALTGDTGWNYLAVTP